MKAMRKCSLALLLCFWPLRAAHSFTCSFTSEDGPSLYWTSRDISYVINADLSADLPDYAAINGIQGAFDTWEAVSGSDITFTYDGLSNSRMVETKHVAESRYRDTSPLRAIH